MQLTVSYCGVPTWKEPGRKNPLANVAAFLRDKCAAAAQSDTYADDIMAADMSV